MSGLKLRCREIRCRAPVVGCSWENKNRATGADPKTSTRRDQRVLGSPIRLPLNESATMTITATSTEPVDPTDPLPRLHSTVLDAAEQRRIRARTRYRARKALALEILGGKCVRCGSADQLEFDHIDPATKSFTITHRMLLGWGRVLAELAKCQLLCDSCHIAKTIEDGPPHNKRAEVVHRHITTYTDGCRCEPCRLAKAVRRGTKNPRPAAPELVHGSPGMYNHHKCRCSICREGQRLRLKAYRAARALAAAGYDS